MLLLFCFFFFFFFNDTATTEIYTLSLHDALPISERVDRHDVYFAPVAHGADAHLPRAALQDVHVLVAVGPRRPVVRSEEHTSELQSPCNLVCRLLLEKKKKNKNLHTNVQ